MQDTIITALSTIINVTFIGTITGIVLGSLALIICETIIRGFVIWPSFETRLLIPNLQKGLAKYPKRPISKRISKYLDSAHSRGLLCASKP